MSGNRDAMGVAKSDLETPALCLDIAVYRRNVERITSYLRDRGVAWRPHMKGQKAPELATQALAAGAIGVTCATVYEAEVMASAGVASILIGNQIAGDRKTRRLARLEQQASVIAATDSAVHLAQLASAAAAEGTTIPVVIELNVGMNRCGVAPGAAALDLARLAHTTRGLRLAGLMGWEGHVLSFEPEEKRRRIQAAIGELVRTAEMCRDAGLPVDVVSAAGSGTFLDSANCAGITEVQAGGAVFSDLSYQKWGLEHEFALTVLTRVVSRPSATRIIVDGGFKTMSSQHGLPKPLIPSVVKSLVLSAEHGNLEMEEPSEWPRVGDVVEFIPGYTDSTLCLHDQMCVIRDGVLEAVWVIPGRMGR